ncbi:uncharacterized protein BDZ99DRAFT_403732, partial [Mytilinidion resinicola]
GWSFIKDPRNQELGFRGVHGKRWLSNWVSQEQKIRERFINIRASNPAAAIVAKAMRVFRQYLAALVHITGGLPARGIELITVQH